MLYDILYVPGCVLPQQDFNLVCYTLTDASVIALNTFFRVINLDFRWKRFTSGRNIKGKYFKMPYILCLKNVNFQINNRLTMQ